MNILAYIASINKISILAFVVTLGFLVWEFRQMKKQQQKGQTPTIPQFDQSATPIPIENQEIELATDPAALKRSQYHKILFIALIVMVIFFGIMSIVSLFAPKQPTTPAGQAQVVVQEVRSTGIKVYTKDWTEIKDDKLNTIAPGDTLILGVVNIKGTGIDKARIRVNSNQWTVDTITSQYDTPHNVYYRDYQVATGESQLQVEAQLHSQSDGWLSE